MPAFLLAGIFGKAKMARTYTTNDILVRKTDELTIVFFDPYTIYLKSRWRLVKCSRIGIRERGYYHKCFKPFSEKLKQNKYIDMSLVQCWAQELGIQILSAGKIPLSERKLKVLRSAGRRRHRQDFKEYSVEEIKKEIGYA